MNRLITSIVLAFGILLGVGLFFSTNKEQSVQQAPMGVLRVVTSFYPLGYVVSSIAGGRAQVEVLTPAGAEPHDFEPTLRDIADLSTADLFLYNGAGFEPWVSSWNEGSFTRPRIVLDMVAELQKRSVPLITHNGSIDPHIWLDPTVFSQEVIVVRDALIALDPTSVDLYTENAKHLLEKLSMLDTRFKDGLMTCGLREIVVSHNAFSYPARAYGFSTIAISGISPDEEPSSKVLSSIIDTVRLKKIPAIFFESTVSPKLSEVVAREVGVSTLVLNPLESLNTDEVQSGEDYITIMEKNLNNLRTALLCH